MKPSAHHKIFLQKRPYDLRVENTGIFTPDELEMLINLGFWMDALERKWIEPETKEQREFVEFCHSNREPASDFERVWNKLKELRAFENPSSSAAYDHFKNALINPGGNPDDWWSNPNR